MVSCLQQVLGDKAIVFGSGNKIMGISADRPSPVQLGPERKGAVASLAFLQDKLYYVERLGVKELYEPIHKLGTEGFMLPSHTRDTSTGRRYHDTENLIVHDDVLYGVRPAGIDSSKNLGSAVVVNVITGEEVMERQGRMRSSYYGGLFNGYSSPEGIHVLGNSAGFNKHIVWDPLGKRRVGSHKFQTQHFAVEPTSGWPNMYLINCRYHHENQNDHVIRVSEMGKEDYAFMFVNVYSHIFSHRGLDRKLVQERMGEPHMACAMNGHVVIAALDYSGNNLYGIDVSDMRDLKEGEMREVMPVKILSGAFEVAGRYEPQSNPMIVLPSANDLEFLIKEASD